MAIPSWLEARCSFKPDCEAWTRPVLRAGAGAGAGTTTLHVSIAAHRDKSAIGRTPGRHLPITSHTEIIVCC